MAGAIYVVLASACFLEELETTMLHFILVGFLAFGGWLAYHVITNGFTGTAVVAAVVYLLAFLSWLHYLTPQNVRDYRKLVRDNRRIGKARRKARKELDG